jgi:beta-lactamase regulating signal transducer with metallopeptidase domain
MSSAPLQFLFALAAKGTILLIATALAAMLARRARASVRHALWAAGLTGLLLVPGLSLGLPRWEVISLPAPVAAPFEPVIDPPVGALKPAVSGAARTEIAPASREDAPVQRQPAAPAANGFDFARAVTGTWIAGAGTLLAWLLFGHLRVRAIVRAADPRLCPEWQASVDDVLALMPIGFVVRFRETPSAMPMAAGIVRPVVLLPAAGAGWTAAHRRDVVVHELAHVRRRDCLTHLASRIACSIHWFNPLAWVAGRQARVEREHACDDAVLAAGALPSSYAQALLETARSAPAAWATASAGLTMARPSHLANRLLAVLDGGRRRGRLGRVAFGAASFGTLALLAPVAAMAPAGPTAPIRVRAIDSPPAVMTAGPVLTHVHTSGPASPLLQAAGHLDRGYAGLCVYSKGGTHRTVRLTDQMRITGMGSADDGKGNAFVAWTGADCSVVIHVVGEPVFTGDESDVASFKGSGRFTVTDSEGRTETVYDVRGDGASLHRSYAVDREEQPVSADAGRWIAGMIVEYVRQSGYQAEARAQRILAARGVAGLLEEISAIRSDYGRGRYYLAGIAARPTAAEIRQFLDHAAGHLDSDYEKGRVLSAVPVALLGEPGIRTSFLEVTRSIDSDYEKARALVAISGAGLDPASTHTALTAATTVTSSYERSRVLQAVTKSAPAGRDLDPLYFDAVTGIDSDYEKGQVLVAYAQHGSLSAVSLGRLYAAAASIGSSNDLANLLVASIGSSASVSDRCSGYLAAASHIDSDYDKARALLALSGAATLTPACANAATVTAGGIQSSNDRARVLIDFVGRGFLTEATRVEFFRATRGLDSSYDLRRVLTAVLAQGRLPAAVLTDLLETAAGIDSDNDLASVLVAAAGTGQIVDAMRPAYLRAVGHLSSDYERKRALAAIGAQ